MDNGNFDLGEYNKKQDEYLGMTVWWEVDPCCISLEDVNFVFDKYGFEKDSIRKPSCKKAFSRATSATEKSHKGVLARRIVDVPQKSVVGVVGEVANEESESLTYKQEATIRLNKEKRTIESYGDESIGSEFRNSYEKYLDVVTEADLRAFVRKMIESNDGIRLRQKGLVYFIPRKNENKIMDLDKMLREIKVGKLGLMRVVNGVRERKETWDSFADNIEERVSETLEKVSKIGKRAGCLAKHEDRMNEIKKMADAYIGLCEEEEKVEDIRSMLENAGNKITEKMAELNEVK